MNRAFFFFLFFMLLISFSPAQRLPTGKLEYIETIYEDAENIASGFKNAIVIKESFCIVTIMLGLLITAIQSFKFSRKQNIQKSLIITFGLIISFATAVESKIFTYDIKLARKCETQSKIILNEMYKLYLSVPDPTKDENLIFAISSGYEEILNLRNLLYTPEIDNQTTTIGLLRNFTFGAKLYAQEPKTIPNWIINPPNDIRSLYFLGKYSSTNLDEAQKLSLNDAIQKAAISIELTISPKIIEENASSISQFLSEKTSIYNTFFEYDKESKLFISYVLIGINKKYLSDYLKLYELQNLKRIENREDIIQLLQMLSPQY